MAGSSQRELRGRRRPTPSTRTWVAKNACPTANPLAPYDRERELARLALLWPHEVGDATVAGRARLIRLLRRALRAERRRGLAGHWSYDLARHVQLLRAYRAELELLRQAPG